jgi:predicted dithiol-disulfide oxidoreductase (DUF899 family)
MATSSPILLRNLKQSATVFAGLNTWTIVPAHRSFGASPAGSRFETTSELILNNRGDEAMGSTWSYLDMSALGRQEESVPRE